MAGQIDAAAERQLVVHDDDLLMVRAADWDDGRRTRTGRCRGIRHPSRHRENGSRSSV